jgi:hypothetical protein
MIAGVQLVGRNSAAYSAVLGAALPRAQVKSFDALRDAASRRQTPTSLRGALATKQSSFAAIKLDCFASLAMTLMEHA